MKKTFIANATVVLLVAGLLAACGNSGSATQKDSSGDKAPAAKATDKKASAKSTSSASDSQEADSSSSSTPTKEKTYSDVTSDIKQKVGAQWLPAAVSTDKAHVTATANVNNGASTVKFFGTDAPVAVNDAKLNGATPVYTLTKTVYANTATAIANINWSGTDQGLPTVALGDNQTATKEGAAGSTYLHWNEGKWSLLVRASNVNNQDPTALGKQLVELFRTKALPAPTDKGAASFNLSDSQGGQSIVWNNGATVYTLTGTDALATAQTAVH